MGKRIFSLLVSLLLILSSGAAWGLDPSSLKVKVYGVLVSTSALCTNPIAIFQSSEGSYLDFLASPSLGGGDPPDDTYNCVIVRMSDFIQFKPATSGGSCSGGIEYTSEICTTTDGATDLAGTSVPCTGSHAGTALEDTVYLFLSTGSTGTGANAFQIPTAANPNYGIRLAAPLVISSLGSAKFVVDGTGKVDGSGAVCGMNAPAFRFSKL